MNMPPIKKTVDPVVVTESFTERAFGIRSTRDGKWEVNIVTYKEDGTYTSKTVFTSSLKGDAVQRLKITIAQEV